VDVFQVEELQKARKTANKAYLEFVREPSMSVGLYEIPAGGVDGQLPHTEDEVYYVIKGRAKFVQEGEDVDVKAGTVIYVPAHKEHRFHSITEDITVLVFFAPAEYSRMSPQ
jgi:mannose-6-phosphate isomerase-like protein (cupin superfamily)